MKKIMIMAVLVMAAAGPALAQSKRTVPVSQKITVKSGSNASAGKTAATMRQDDKATTADSKKKKRQLRVATTQIPTVKGTLIPQSKIKKPARQTVVKKTDVSTSAKTTGKSLPKKVNTKK